MNLLELFRLKFKNFLANQNQFEIISNHRTSKLKAPDKLSVIITSYLIGKKSQKRDEIFWLHFFESDFFELSIFRLVFEDLHVR